MQDTTPLLLADGLTGPTIHPINGPDSSDRSVVANKGPARCELLRHGSRVTWGIDSNISKATNLAPEANTHGGSAHPALPKQRQPSGHHAPRPREYL